MKKIIIAGLLGIMVAMTGCTSVENYAGTREGKYTLGGAALGAVSGGIIGGDAEGALVGAGVGALAGYTAGEITKNK